MPRLPPRPPRFAMLALARYRRRWQRYRQVRPAVSAGERHQQFVQTLNSSGIRRGRGRPPSSQSCRPRSAIAGCGQCTNRNVVGASATGDGAPGTATSPNGGGGWLLYGNGGTVIPRRRRGRRRGRGSAGVGNGRSRDPTPREPAATVAGCSATAGSAARGVEQSPA